MPFTFYSPPSLTAEQASPYGNLVQNALGTYSAAIKARYQPMISLAEASSKLAYANLMGPQFLAKLMGHSDILANMTDEQKAEGMRKLYAAGTGQGTGFGFLNPQAVSTALGGTQQPQQQEPQQQEQEQPQQPEQQQPEQQQSQSSDDQRPIHATVNDDETPYTGNVPIDYDKNGYPIYAKGATPPAAAATTPAQGPAATAAQQPGGKDYAEETKAADAWLGSKEAADQAKKDGYISFPDRDKLMAWYKAQQQKAGAAPVAAQPAAAQPVAAPAQQAAPDTPPPPESAADFPSQPKKDFAQNAADYAGRKKEGEAMGEQRVKDMSALNDNVFAANTDLTTLGEISKILASSQFEQIRQVPAAGHHELAYYAKFGTPEQKDMVGRYYALTGQVVKDSSRDFPGQFRTGEQKLLEGMKPSPGDTVDVARGKTEALMQLRTMVRDRAKLISGYMEKFHVSKGSAETIADQQVQGDKIRDAIVDKVYPPVQIRSKKTGEVRTVPRSQAKKLGVRING